jgi:hypothetical protein
MAEENTARVSCWLQSMLQTVTHQAVFFTGNGYHYYLRMSVCMYEGESENMSQMKVKQLTLME